MRPVPRKLRRPKAPRRSASGRLRRPLPQPGPRRPVVGGVLDSRCDRTVQAFFEPGLEFSQLILQFSFVDLVGRCGRPAGLGRHFEEHWRREPDSANTRRKSCSNSKSGGRTEGRFLVGPTYSAQMPTHAADAVGGPSPPTASPCTSSWTTGCTNRTTSAANTNARASSRFSRSTLSMSGVSYNYLVLQFVTAVAHDGRPGEPAGQAASPYSNSRDGCPVVDVHVADGGRPRPVRERRPGHRSRWIFRKWLVYKDDDEHRLT